MLSSRTYAFIKFFNEESHADQFIKGSLYMNRLQYFKNLEASAADDGRPDAQEGIVMWHQPDRIELTIEMTGFPSIKIGKDDLAGPVAISRNFHSYMHMFCMCTLSIPDPAGLGSDHGDVLAQLQHAFQVDDRCLSFGPFAVIVPAARFLPQLTKALEQFKGWSKADKVEYYDERTFHGEFALKDVPFRKQSRFAYQKEYRVCIQTDTIDEKPIIFEIGDLSAFAYKVGSADLNTSLKVTLKEPSS